MSAEKILPRLLADFVNATEERASAEIMYAEATNAVTYYEQEIKPLIKENRYYIVECADEYAVGTYVVSYTNGVFKVGYAVKGDA